MSVLVGVFRVDKKQGSSSSWLVKKLSYVCSFPKIPISMLEQIVKICSIDFFDPHYCSKFV